MISSDYAHLDQVLFALKQKIRPLKFVNPLNSAEEKQKFLNGEVSAPDFHYPQPEYDSSKVNNQLLQLTIPNYHQDFFQIFDRFKTRLILENQIIQNIGNTEVITKLSKELYGEPNQSQVSAAIQILESSDLPQDKTDIADFDAKYLKSEIKDIFSKLQLPTNWEVEISSRATGVITSVDGKIFVPADGLYSAQRVKELINHEVGVHALRGANGIVQPLKIFSQALHGYSETEEGLASTSELLVGKLSSAKLSRFAGRVVAVASLHQGLSFFATFQRLAGYSCFSSEDTYDIVARVYRGGGFAKDHIYFCGFEKIKDYLLQNGDIKLLYAGKISIADAPLVSRLIQDGHLNPPQHLPWFIDQLNQKSLLASINEILPTSS